MQTKLTIDHLSCYLPYGLKAECSEGIIEIFGLNAHANSVLNINGFSTFYITEIKPILRPLSDLFTYPPYMDEYSDSDNGYFYHTKEDWFTDESGNITHSLKDCISWEPKYMQKFLNTLYKHKIDIHSLISQGLAISIHDVEGDIY